MISHRPKSLDFIAAASVPVVAVTAWQMLFDYAKARSGQSVLILGGAGNVGAYAVQLAAEAGLTVYATASSQDIDYVRGLGAKEVIDYKAVGLEEAVPIVDIVLDTVGGNLQARALTRIRPGGVLVSIVSEVAQKPDSSIQTMFFLVQVTSERLDILAERFNSGRLQPNVGTVLPFDEVQLSHEMLDGAPHPRGKIVLQVANIS
jgi:NADPH:quinone reductase-like Zn-dependent oxidoreductase